MFSVLCAQVTRLELKLPICLFLICSLVFYLLSGNVIVPTIHATNSINMTHATNSINMTETSILAYHSFACLLAQVNMTIVLVAHDKFYMAFEDYIDDIRAVLPATVQLYRDIREIKLNANTAYGFVQQIPKDLYRDLHKAGYVWVINTEQLSFPNGRNLDIVNTALNKGFDVWDYSNQNILYTKHSNHIYVPPFGTALRMLYFSTPKIYDVVFVGHLSRVREKLLLRLRAQGLKVEIVRGRKEERDARLAQGKVLINPHFGPTYKIFEQLRCDRWIFAGMIVTSETSFSQELFDLRTLTTFASYDNMPAVIVTQVAAFNLSERILLFNTLDEMAKKRFDLVTRVIDNMLASWKQKFH
jgi:hypothetical protein